MKKYMYHHVLSKLNKSNRTMHMKKEEMISRMDRIIHWVEICDTKTSILLAVQAMVLTIVCSTDFVFDAVKKVLSDTFFFNGEKEFSFWGLMVIIFLLLLIVAFTVSINHLFKVLKAKTSAKQTNDENVRDKDSLIHFQCIADKAEFKDYLAFRDRIESEKEDDEIHDILSQIFINASRCDEKFNHYNKGLEALIWALVFLIIFIFVIFMYHAFISTYYV